MVSGRMSSYALRDTAKKFLFDVNSFEIEDRFQSKDVIVQDEIEPIEAIFTQADLDKATEEAYENGKRDATIEFQEKEEKLVSKALSDANKNIKILINAEAERSAKYEAEAINLSLHVMKKIFPTYSQAYGLEEVRNTISNVIKKNKDNETPPIKARVHTDHVVALSDMKECGVSIEGDSQLGYGDCKVLWNNGGALRDANSLADSISDALSNSVKGTLASLDQTGNDKKHD